MEEGTPVGSLARRETEIWGDSVDSGDLGAPRAESALILERLFSKHAFTVQPSETEQAVVTTTSAKRPSKKSIIILMVCLMLLILVAVGIYLLVYLLLFDSAEDEVKHYMNLSENPCHDFYNYACGGWQAKERAKNSLAIVSLRAFIHDIVQSQITGMLKKDVVDGEPKYKSQAKKFFSACNNIDRLVERGNAPFFEFLKKFGKFPILNPAWKREDTELQNLITQLTLLDLGPFFNVVPDNSLGMNFFKITGPKKASIIDIVALEKTLTLLGVSDQTPNFRAELEALISMHQEASRMDLGSEQKETNVKIKDLKVYMDLAFDFNWLSFLETVIGGKTIYLDTYIVVVNQPHIVAYQKRLFQKFDIRDIVNFMMLPLLAFTSLLDPKFFYEAQEKGVAAQTASKTIRLGKSSSNTPETNMDGYDKAKRMLRCLKEVDGLFSIPVRKMYVEEFYSSSLGPTITDMFQDVKAAFRDEFESSTWLNSATAKSTKKIMDAMKEHHGDMENFNDETFLNEIYGQVPTDEYFEFVVGLLQHLVRMSLMSPEKLPRQTGSSIDTEDSLHIGLSYSRVHNYLYLPAAFLQKPFVDSNWPTSMNYGALGSEIGKVMMTAWFDEFYEKTSQPLKNQEYGTKSNFDFDNQHRNNMMVIKKQMGCQTSALDNVKGVAHLNDETLGAFCIKSSSGLRASYLAYHLHRDHKGEQTKTLLGLDLTHDQLFFLGFAQAWCEYIPKERLREYLANSVLTGSMRVQAAISTSTEFSKAYGCKKGDAMYPQLKCDFFQNVTASV